MSNNHKMNYIDYTTIFMISIMLYLHRPCHLVSISVNLVIIYFNLLVNNGPSEIFRVHSASLCNAIEADPLRIVNSLIAEKLLSSHVRNDVTSMNGTSYDKANKIVGELQRQIAPNDNPVQFLKQICDVLKNQEDITLSNIGDKMMNLLTPDHHSKTSTNDNTQNHKLVI